MFQWVAARGAGVGAAKVLHRKSQDTQNADGNQWAIFSAVAAGLGFAFSPLYKGTTVQFKV